MFHSFVGGGVLSYYLLPIGAEATASFFSRRETLKSNHLVIGVRVPLQDAHSPEGNPLHGLSTHHGLGGS